MNDSHYKPFQSELQSSLSTHAIGMKCPADATNKYGPGFIKHNLARDLLINCTSKQL